MSDFDFDLVILGSGSAAFAAAIRATESGARVAMVEQGTVGGTCVNVGCVPSKTLLRGTEMRENAQSHPFRGIVTTAGAIDWPQAIQQKDELVGSLRHEKYVNLAVEYGWEMLTGRAVFENGPAVRVGDRRLLAPAYLVATGAEPAVPSIPGLEESGFLTSTTLLERQAAPESLLVIGAGFIALELGNVFARLGTRVTLVQRGPRLLPEYEPEISEAVAGHLEEAGLRWLPSSLVQRVERHGGARRVVLERNGVEETVEAEEVLVAVGRRARTADLGLDLVGVQLDGGGAIMVNEYLQSTNPRIFAAGDVTGGRQFVYVAAAEGGRAAGNALGEKVPLDLGPVPDVIFTHPQIATVGLTERQARDQGIEIDTSLLPLSLVPRALVNRDTRGLFKLVAERETGRLLGAHVLAENAGEVIYAAVLAIRHGLTTKDLVNSLAPYLTMSEGLKLAALGFYGTVKKLSCCAS